MQNASASGRLHHETPYRGSAPGPAGVIPSPIPPEYIPIGGGSRGMPLDR